MASGTERTKGEILDFMMKSGFDIGKSTGWLEACAENSEVVQEAAAGIGELVSDPTQALEVKNAVLTLAAKIMLKSLKG